MIFGRINYLCGYGHHLTGNQFSIRDRRPTNCPPQQEVIQLVNPATPVEPVRPFPQIPWKMLRADAVIRAIQPGLHVREQIMDDGHIHTSVDARFLGRWDHAGSH